MKSRTFSTSLKVCDVLPNLRASSRSHLCPDDVVDDQEIGTGDKRAILASWGSDARAVEGQPALRRVDGGAVIHIDDIMRALKRLDSAPDDPQVELSRPCSIGSRTFVRRARATSLTGARRGRWGHRTRDDDDDPPPSAAFAVRPGPRPPLVDAASQRLELEPSVA